MNIVRLLSVLVSCALLCAACGDDGSASGTPGDQDADGVADEIDVCPKRPGPGPSGCPLLAFEPTSAPSGSLIYVAGNAFNNASVVRFGHTDARTIVVNNQTLLVIVPFLDESTLQPLQVSDVSVQVDGVTATQLFSVTELAATGQPAGSVLTTAADDARAELDDMREDLETALVATRNIAQRPTLIELVSASLATLADVQTALTGLSTLATDLPADAVDALERVLSAERRRAPPPASPVCVGSEMDRLLCDRVDYAARVVRSRQLQRTLCGLGQVIAARDETLATSLAEACAVAGFADLLGTFLLVPEVTNVDLAGPQSLEVGAEAVYTPRVTVNRQALIDILHERLISTLVSIGGEALPTPSIDSWYTAVNAAVYWYFWELQQNNERTGDASAGNFVWWSSAVELQLLSDGRVHLHRDPPFAPMLVTVDLESANQTDLERQRAMLLPCSQSLTCRSAAIGVGVQQATLELTQLECESVANVPELGGGSGLRISVGGVATGPVAATFAASITQPGNTFTVGDDTSCGTWSVGEQGCTRTTNQPEVLTFDYTLVCGDSAAQPCPQVPFGIQVNGAVRRNDGTTLASRAMFVTCFAPE